MSSHDSGTRRSFLKLGALVASQSTLPGLSIAAGNGPGDVATDVTAQLDDGLIQLQFDAQMRCAVSCHVAGRPVQLSAFGFSEFLQCEDGSRLARFRLTSSQQDHIDDARFGAGQRLALRGLSAELVEKQVTIRLFRRVPGVALVQVRYINHSQSALALKSWTNGAARVSAAAHGVDQAAPLFWSFSGATFPDRRDWVQPLHNGFDQANYMGMNGSDYGGGTPIADVWRRDCGLAVGHVEPVPKLVSLPISVRRNQATLCVTGAAKTLAPGESLDTPLTFVAVHHGDYFSTLDRYRQLMADQGLAAPHAPDASYQPIWCAWGYERSFTMDLVEGTLDKARDLGLDWAVIDDGWQTANGDWYVDVKKFPRGADDLKALAQRIRQAGMKPRLWFSPLAVGPGTDLLHDHTDMLLLDQDGAVQNITWWNCFYLCPAYEPTVTYTKKLIRTILADWGFEGIKIDGQHLNGVAPCFNPAHHHERPEQSVEQLQNFYRAIYDTAMEINPDAVIEICPCGTSYAFHNMPYMNQAPASDPLSSWQVRHKGKTLKALMGASAPYAGDHVELSDGKNDFASTVGIGAVVSTKFTWPIDPKLKDSFLLTAANEEMWRKWIGLYNHHRLPQGRYMGELYDIGFDRPEAHAIAKDDCMYYAFYGSKWHGRVALRGLPAGRFIVRDYVNDVQLTELADGQRHIDVQFDQHLLLEVRPA